MTTDPGGSSSLADGLPATRAGFRALWAAEARRLVARYAAGATSFVPGLLPEQALELSIDETLRILRDRHGATVDVALDEGSTDPGRPAAELPAILRGPAVAERDGRWLRDVHIVGVNIRTVGDVWGVVRYSLTLPATRSAIHLLPIWEPGVVGSMYGPSSWTLDRGLLSPSLAERFPWLDTAERQLRAVVNLLHATGQSVGMDVIPHADRFSEMALGQPFAFEWLQRDDARIVRHGDDLIAEVEALIHRHLLAVGPAVAAATVPATPDGLFRERSEADRLALLFGRPDDAEGRLQRRLALLRRLYEHGFETVPATMAPPFRGLEVDDRPEARIVDAEGMVWRDYRITRPTGMSRVFGPLARYRLYETRTDGDGWDLDFGRPVEAVWRYVCEHYADVQRRFGFDFMRGDMAHVQMRPSGVPTVIDEHYDILGAVKAHVRLTNDVPHFASFAEAFLAPRDVFGFGEELDHLEASGADIALGDLQSTTIGTPEFIQRLRQYEDDARARRCTPCLTVMTADKDDPRFDGFYLAGNEARLFVALFLPGMPSYMGLGFETRDPHPAPAPNEHYSKFYVFEDIGGPRETHGPFAWGGNAELFRAVTRMRLLRDTLIDGLVGRPMAWRLAPDATAARRVISWTVAADGADLLFVADLDPALPAGPFGVPIGPREAASPRWVPLFSTRADTADEPSPLASNGVQWIIDDLAPGEARVYRAARPDPADEGG